MSANNKQGFQFPQGLRIKLTPSEAKKRHENNLARLEREHQKLQKMLDELTAEIERDKAA